VIFFQERERKINASGHASQRVEIVVLDPDRLGSTLTLG